MTNNGDQKDNKKNKKKQREKRLEGGETVRSDTAPHNRRIPRIVDRHPGTK